ncbi:MAG: TsoY family (seleno)protein [Candidatus Marinarcus sp.]|uniref:TsoY family (seleno)protein n=1 Tax=Candidatus Marinarcus sp. TaxID=3100987 RepID=UPI003AFFBC33
MELREKFTPMCFLSALSAGGLAVSFFMYLMFLVPHKGVPMATFDFIYPVILQGNWLSVVSVLAMIFILVFSFLHFKFLIWNTKQFNLFKKTEKFEKLKNSNDEISLMTIPLTYAMTINVCFVIGAVFVPSLWSIVEYMFPFALIAFAVAGYFALKIFFNYLTRILTKGNFDFANNNNLSQMISIFSFAMVSVGFAAPGAMSLNISINAIGIMGSLFFASIAVLLLLIKMTIGFTKMFEKGIAIEASPSLWIIIPILTLLGIAYVRISFGLNHHFNSPLANSSLFTFSTVIVSLQIIFGILGYQVMKKLGYFEEFIEGENRSPVSFALICPGVAFMVFGMFFVNFGLTFNGVIEKYSLSYFLIMLPFMFVQYKTILYFFKLKRKFNF